MFADWYTRRYFETLQRELIASNFGRSMLVDCNPKDQKTKLALDRGYAYHARKRRKKGKKLNNYVCKEKYIPKISAQLK